VASFFGHAANRPAVELAPLAIPSLTLFDTLLEASADLNITHNWTALAVGKVCVPNTRKILNAILRLLGVRIPAPSPSTKGPGYRMLPTTSSDATSLQ
jgi:hypothetical protein